MSLTKTQSRAVAYGKGPCICLAGPGSGKTTVITQRTKYLIEEHGVKPHEILVITFTRAAAMEMRERFQILTGRKYNAVTFGTFHAVFFQILKHAYHYTAANILKEDMRYRFLREIVDAMDLELDDEAEFMTGISSEISRVKNERIALEHYYSANCSEEIFRKIYQKYENRLARENLLDFDDMLVYCYQLLKEREDIRAGWQRRFPYILIDEFQDINQIQYDTIRLLAEPGNNLFIVGDDDQSIYHFRGARPEIMLNFKKDYPDAGEIMLEENFRSVEHIISASSRVIRHNKNRYDKKIHGVREPGDKVSVHGCLNPPQESLFVLKKVQEYLQAGYRYQDIALLFRTNTGARPMVEKFMEYNLPFRMRDTMPSLYDHWIAKDIISYMHLAMGSRERKEFLRIINKPKRYVSRECLDNPQISFEMLKSFYQDKDWMVERIDRLEYDIEWLGKMAPFAAINFIRKGIGYEDYLEEYAQYRRMKVEDLYEVLDELQESARAYSAFQAWFDHMEEYNQALAEQSVREKGEEDAATFTTLHSAKGLEFPIVFLIDANEDIMPHKKAVLDVDIQEERRMFYVGMTRAKDHLHILHVKEQHGKKMQPSRFIGELSD